MIVFLYASFLVKLLFFYQILKAKSFDDDNFDLPAGMLISFGFKDQSL